MRRAIAIFLILIIVFPAGAGSKSNSAASQSGQVAAAGLPFWLIYLLAQFFYREFPKLWEMINAIIDGDFERAMQLYIEIFIKDALEFVIDVILPFLKKKGEVDKQKLEQIRQETERMRKHLKKIKEHTEEIKKEEKKLREIEERKLEHFKKTFGEGTYRYKSDFPFTPRDYNMLIYQRLRSQMAGKAAESALDLLAGLVKDEEEAVEKAYIVTGYLAGAMNGPAAMAALAAGAAGLAERLSQAAAEKVQQIQEEVKAKNVNTQQVLIDLEFVETKVKTAVLESLTRLLQLQTFDAIVRAGRRRIEKALIISNAAKHKVEFDDSDSSIEVFKTVNAVKKGGN